KFEYVLPQISGTGCTDDDTWKPTIVSSPPATRLDHSGVWTGTEMIIWGGWNGSNNLNTGGKYDPATDTWVPTSTVNAPTLSGHVRVWSGSELIVWNGQMQVGARYNPSTDSWQTISISNAPAVSTGVSAVWNGSEMMVWGWTGPINVGGKYNPNSNSWTSITNVGAPSARFHHSAIWTGTEMIIWGGYGCADPPTCNSWDELNNGGRYLPGSNSWLPMSTSNAPIARELHSTVWTGSTMIVWGGQTTPAGSFINSGGIYDPNLDQWTASTSLINAPVARADHTAIWTGSEMIIWGDQTFIPEERFSGGRYNPATDSWSATTQTGAPQILSNHTAIWTGAEMIVWGGDICTPPTCGALPSYSIGGRYNPQTDSWIPTNSSGTPEARLGHKAVWTGSEMIIWGGAIFGAGDSITGARYDPAIDTWQSMSIVDAPITNDAAVWTGTEFVVLGDANSPPPYITTGGKYNPSTDSWTATSIVNAPESRAGFTAVWTGTEVIMWGGSRSFLYFSSGGRYNPSTDTWLPTGMNNVPEGRGAFTAKWTGSKMIIWGGYNDVHGYLQTGGQYDPNTDSWTATSLNQAAEARTYFSSVWTGSEMIIWGGTNGPSSLATGARYNPSNDTWIPISTSQAPAPRISHTGVWADDRMIIWGGTNGNYLNTGALYDPVDDSWTSTSLINAPDPRSDHSAVWTGSEMIAWGGIADNISPTGGLYCHVSQAPPCLLSDDFEDGIIDPSIWTIVKDSWQESSGDLVGIPAKRKAFIFASGFAGCDHCTIQTSVSTSGGSFAKVWVIGWYQDKNNHI
ncbi:MAG TPA: hypothetical protein VH815_01265, partial [Acidobacteriota bacterium]